MVCQYAKEYRTDNVGDPFMVVLPSIQAFSYNVTFPVLTLSENPQYFISITSECSNIESFYLDGMPLINNERILQTSDGIFCVLRTSITTAFHSVTHPSASFLVMVYGFAILYGYGYVAGYNIGPNMEASGDTSTASNVMPSGCLPIMTIYSDEGTIAPAKNLYEYGDVITVFCRKGLHHIGDDQLVCLNTGSWLGEIPRCSTDNEEDDSSLSTSTIIVVAAVAVTVSVIGTIAAISIAIIQKNTPDPGTASYSTHISTIAQDSHNPVQQPYDNTRYHISFDNMSYESPGADRDVPNYMEVH
ncbi:uncharacterized protein [Amphiura filiformis]|uniref:uncharacterized protein n=1 Tax=Amphiura filiformis TaxID=82378 RepID=UPI003B218359